MLRVNSSEHFPEMSLLYTACVSGYPMRAVLRVFFIIIIFLLAEKGFLPPDNHDHSVLRII